MCVTCSTSSPCLCSSSVLEILVLVRLVNHTKQTFRDSSHAVYPACTSPSTTQQASAASALWPRPRGMIVDCLPAFRAVRVLGRGDAHLSLYGQRLWSGAHALFGTRLQRCAREHSFVYTRLLHQNYEGRQIASTTKRVLRCIAIAATQGQGLPCPLMRRAFQLASAWATVMSRFRTVSTISMQLMVRRQ